MPTPATPRLAWRRALLGALPLGALGAALIGVARVPANLAKTLRYAWLGRLTWGRALLGGSRPAPGPRARRLPGDPGSPPLARQAQRHPTRGGNDS